MKLTGKQLSYIEHRAAGMGQAQAARAAGYSARTAKVSASRLERRQDIRDAIAAKKPAAPASPPTFADAEDYLSAVVCGTATPDPVRVSAARALMSYTVPRKRQPMRPEKTPRQQASSDALASEQEQQEAWRAKVVEIRSKLKR
jgi:hypothetical protein